MASQAERTRAQVAELVQEFQRQPGDTGSTPVQGKWLLCLRV